jgi:hypothetical protein
MQITRKITIGINKGVASNLFLADLKLPIQNKNATKNNIKGKVIFIPCNGIGNGKGMAKIEIRIKVAGNI